MWLTGDDEAPAEAAATTRAPAQQFDDARAGAPTAPAQVACGAEIPPKVKRPTFSKPPANEVDPAKSYLATFQTSCGRFTVRLDPKKAPVTTANFVFLAGKKFYDSTWFHRIVPGGQAGIAVIQGGDPEGSGRGGPGYAIKDELPSSPAAYKRYSVAMANSGPDSGGSQFFISFEDNSEGLQAKYSVFGEVTDGREVVDKIAKVPVGGQTGDTPAQSVWIDKLTVKVS
jgi:cyclophilin family peptidyl-prolyl cis-trans isomerase